MTLSLKPPRIGIFDSGLGGLSVWREVQRVLPHASLIYVADSAHAPYGDQNPDYIVERSLAIAKFLMAQNIDALLIACNTASAHAVETLRSTYSLPIVAIEPAIKPAVQSSQSKKIAVLATSQTLASERLQRLVDRHGVTGDIFFQACPGLVEWVEAGAQASDEQQTLLHGYLQPLIAQGVDTLVLGCTHYPFLVERIEEAIETSRSVLNDPSLPSSVHLINPAPAVALELARRLSSVRDSTEEMARPTGAIHGQATRGEHLFYSNHHDLEAQTKITQMLGMSINFLPFRD